MLKLLLIIVFIIINISSFNPILPSAKNNSDNPIQENASPPIVQPTSSPSNQLDILNTQAFELFMAKKYSKAVNITNDILKQDINNYKAYNIKGIALCFLGNFKEGMCNIDKSLSINPDFAYARFNKALAYELHHYYDKSLIWYDNALQIEENAWSYYGEASIYGRKGDVKNTIQFLKKAIQLEPSAKECAKTESDFDNVRKYSEFQELLK